MPGVLVFYCCLTNHHKLGDFKEHPLVTSVLYVRSWGSLLTVSQSWNQGIIWRLRKESTSKLPHCWLKSIPCSCRTEIPVSLVTVGHGALLALEAVLRSFPCVPSIFQSRKADRIFPMLQTPDFLFCHQLVKRVFYALFIDASENLETNKLCFSCNCVIIVHCRSGGS